jgi:imidazolonepropionase-like amidohydrolase
MRPGGHCHFLGGEVATAREVHDLIAQQVNQGARFVKVIASGGGLTPGTKPHEAEFPLELMRVAAEVAHAHGVYVTAHCHATEGIERAIETGFDMLEHVSFVDTGGYRYNEEVAKRLRDSGVIVGPTVFGALQLAQRIRAWGHPHNPDDFSAVERLEGRLANVGHFARLGLKMIGGSDCGGASDTPFDSLVDEVLAYTRAGLSNEAALRTVTSDGAAFLGLTALGEIKRGYRADVILLNGNPLEDLSALRRPAMVFRAGRLVHQRDAEDRART